MRQRESNSYDGDGSTQVTTERLHLDLLGAFRLRQADQPVAGFEHARLQHALAYFALHRAGPISRQQRAFLFWPDSTDQQALRNLRTLITRLSQALPGAGHFLEIMAQTVQMRQDAAASETELALATGAQKDNDDPGAVSALAAAAEYTGDLLPDCYDDWILPLRERLHLARETRR